MLKNWNIVRVLRLVFGVVLAYQAIDTHEWIWLLPAVYFLYQALVNTGCTSGRCED